MSWGLVWIAPSTARAASISTSLLNFRAGVAGSQHCAAFDGRSSAQGRKIFAALKPAETFRRFYHSRICPSQGDAGVPASFDPRLLGGRLLWQTRRTVPSR